MNALQRTAVRLAARLVPSLRKLFESAGGTVERLSEEVTLLREREQMRRGHIHEEMAEIREAMAMAGSGPWQGTIRTRESGISGSSSGVILKERLAELELALEDRGWQRQIAASEWEFSRWGIQQIILISRLYFIKNPLIRRGVLVSSYYVFGRGVEVTSEDETANEILQAFFSDKRNLPEIGHIALTEKESSKYTDGNLFFAFFSSPDDGQTVIRSIDALEIQEVVTDPDDGAVPWFYHRRWTQQQFNPQNGLTTPRMMDAWYCALGYEPSIDQINGQPIAKGADGQSIPVLHVKDGGLPKWHFGCPRVYAALDWARAYRHFLEDWATITRALARFSWQVETQGGQPAIAAFKQTLATTLGNSSYQAEQNPPPVTASAFVSGPGNKLTPVKTAGATTEPEQGRRVMLMVAAAFGLPETFFGDASVGSLATSQSLDRPTELKFLEAQERWRETLQVIGQYILDRSAKAPQGKLKEAIAKAKAEGEDEEITIDVKFPSVLEHDIGERITAIVNALTLSGYPAIGIDEKTGIALLLEELGVEDVQAVVDAMYPEDSYEQKRPPPVEIDPKTGQPPNAPKPAMPGKPKEAVVIKAVTELRRALVKLQEKHAK